MPLNQEILEENLSRTVILQLPDLDLILLSPLIEYITLYLPTGKLIFKAATPFLLVTLVYFLPLTLNFIKLQELLQYFNANQLIEFLMLLIDIE